MVHDTMSVTSGEPEGTVTSMASVGRNDAEHEGDEMVDGRFEKRDAKDSHLQLHSPDFNSDLPTSKDTLNIPKDSADNYLGTKTGRSLFVADSGETSSCGSFPESSNGVIMYDRNYSLSPPPPSKGESLEFLNPSYAHTNLFGSPTQLTDVSLNSTPSPDIKNNENREEISPSDKLSASPTVIISEDVTKPVENGNS